MESIAKTEASKNIFSKFVCTNNIIYTFEPMEKEASRYCGCLYFSANALSRIMTKMADEAFSQTGLSSSYAFLLMTVNDHPGIQPKEISFQMQLTPSTVTRLIEKMEHKGYLKREQKGRNTLVHPTAQSKKLNDQIKTAWVQLFKDYAAILGESEAQQLTSSIHQAAQKLE